MAARWSNADGLQVKFGDYVKDPKNYVNKFRIITAEGSLIKTIVMDVDLTKITAGTVAYPDDLNNDGTLDGFDEGIFSFPAYASLISARYIVRTAAAGGTSFTVGTYEKNGTARSATGIFTATEGVLANIDTVGARTNGNGALMQTAVETPSVGATPCFPAIAAQGTFSAGTGLLTVSYIAPFADVSST